MTLARFVPLFALLALVVCAKEVPREERVVLEVAGKPLTLAELDRFVQSSVQQETPVLSSEVMGALFEQFVEEQLLLARADDAGIEADPRIVAQRMEALKAPGDEPADTTIRMSDELVAKNLELQVRIETLVDTEVLSRVSVEESEISAHFEKNQVDFVRPETVDVSQILVDTEEEARELESALKSRRASFEELARERSQGPEADRGGRLGVFARGELPQSFEAEVFALRPGAISGVVSTDFGFHLFRVNEKTPEARLQLEDVREAIRVDLLRKKSDQAMRRYLGSLEERYPVTVHHEHLSFAVLSRAESLESANLEKSR